MTYRVQTQREEIAHALAEYMRQVAEDVEYREYKDYSRERI